MTACIVHKSWHYLCMIHLQLLVKDTTELFELAFRSQRMLKFSDCLGARLHQRLGIRFSGEQNSELILLVMTVIFLELLLFPRREDGVM